MNVMMISTALRFPKHRRIASTTTALIGSFVCGSIHHHHQGVVLCEGNNNNNDNIMNLFFPKNNDGTTNWSKASGQITDQMFWDQFGKAVGGKVQNVIDSGTPTQLSYGFISGYCSGFALKKVGKIVSVIFGLGFMSLQTLSYYGYVKVNHQQIEQDITDMFDLNKDGKFDAKDTAIAQNQLMKILQFNLPAGSGFVTGFIGGLRSG